MQIPVDQTETFFSKFTIKGQVDFCRDGNEDAQHCKQKNFAKFRDEGKIRFSHPEKRITLYDGDSIDQFLEKNAKMFLTIKNDPFDN